LPDQRWYHLTFDDGGWSLPAIYVERVCTNLEVWINGQLVGGGGSMVEPLTRNCYFPQLVRFQRNLLQGTHNRLDIRVVGYPQERVAARQRAGGLSQVLIGEQAELALRYDSRFFWSITLAQVIGVCMLLVGLVIAALGWVRRQDRHNLYFGLALVLWSVMGTRLYVQHLPMTVVASEILFTALYAPFAYAVVQFLLHYVGQQRRWVQRLLVLQCVAVPLLLMLAPAHTLAATANGFYILLGCEFVLSFAIFARQSWRFMRKDFWFVGANLMLLLALTVAEIAIQSGWLALPKIHLIHFAMPAISFAMGLRLVRQFTTALSESERVNRELEQRVADKTAEIEYSYAQLSDLRAEQSAATERQRIASDLHDDLGAQLVTIAQASLYANDIGRVAELARQALTDMRLSVRGLTGAPTPLPHVLADWRSETVERLTLAGVTVLWNANDPPMEWVLPARMQVQVTRILREAVSNVIRHSGAGRCWVDIHVSNDQLQLGVEDDGRGFDTRQASQGQGQGNMQRRALALGGTLEIGPREVGGTSVRLDVPLALKNEGQATGSGGAFP
jgi:signal transduction histidine kinase